MRRFSKLITKKKIEQPQSLPQLPTDMLSCIFSFVPFSKSDWLNIRLVCKQWNFAAERAFDPSRHYSFRRMVRKQNVESIKKLLKDDRIHVLSEGPFAFKQACYYGNMELLNLMLENGNIGSKEEGLVMACAYGHEKLVDRLLEDKTIDPAFNNNQAIIIACQNGQDKVVKRLLEDDRVDPTVDNHEPWRKIFCTYYPNNIKIFDLLWSRGDIDPSICNNEAIVMACNSSQSILVDKLLKDDRVDPNAQNGACLIIAVRYGSLELVEMLLRDKRTDPTMQQYQAFRMAVMRVATVKSIVEAFLKHPLVDPTHVNLGWSLNHANLKIVGKRLVKK
eukprot:TRINITY_DN9630_c0_g1_i1.p1 TRINITY_DN9630_c0_g1~~TRINITY_DN9630_c0_g1_i1.p1  ORF type:complete len:334 (-),score=60.36 TRINITY_DN9630_c0_g1_i1:5-1006(-)